MTNFRGLELRYTNVSSALSKSGLPGLDYALNPYVGCSHGCTYCYARLYTRDRRISQNWGKVVAIKQNLVDVISREAKRAKPGLVGVGTITDPYQPVESVFKLTRSCVEVLLNNKFRVSIQTKNTLVLRDIDVLSARTELVDVGFTITTFNDKVARAIEPRSSPPSARALALERLSSAGVKTWVFYGPIIPGLNDDEVTLDLIASLSSRTGSILYFDQINVKPFMRSTEHELYRYIPLRTRVWWKNVKDRIYKKCRDYGIVCRPGFENTELE
ncbi:MAG: radical SAM protein [Desulfurococcaceae archaeon]